MLKKLHTARKRIFNKKIIHNYSMKLVRFSSNVFIGKIILLRVVNEIDMKTVDNIDGVADLDRGTGHSVSGQQLDEFLV